MESTFRPVEARGRPGPEKKIVICSSAIGFGERVSVCVCVCVCMCMCVGVHTCMPGVVNARRI